MQTANCSIASKSTVPILTYHNIGIAPPNASHRGLYLTPTQFRRQMAMLKFRGYRGVSMQEGLPYLLGKKAGRVAVITFDDGYSDTLEQAMPVLHEYGYGATCYLVSECLGSYNRWDSALLGVEKPLMDTAAVKRWLAGGMAIGSHTCSHPHLATLNPDSKHLELSESKKKLESLFGLAVHDLAYPYGEYDDDCVKIARQCGYRTAVTTHRGTPRGSDDLLALPRLGNSGKKPSFVFFARSLNWMF